MMHPPGGTRRPPKKLLTVRFPIPRAAATILRSMAVSKDPRLLELGVLSVQFKDNERIALGLGVEKEPWEKDKGLQAPASVQRSKTSEMFAHFSDEVQLLSSNADRRNTASKHNSRNVIYAGNGLCSDNNAAVEEKTSQLRLNVGEGSFNSSSETRSRVDGGIRPNLNLELITRKQASDLQSETRSRRQDMPPGRILPPLPRRKRDAESPGSTKSELEKPGKGSKPMLDIFFDQGRFSAASMLMQLAKNHTSKGGTERQEREIDQHSAIDSDKPVITGISTSTDKVCIASEESPHKIPQCQKITVELMEDEEMSSSSNGESPAPVVLSKSTTGTPRTNSVHYEQNKSGIASKPCDITSDSQASTDNGSTYEHCTDIPTIWSGHHISPVHPGNNNFTQSHTDSVPSQTVWSNPSVLSNSQAAHGNCDQMSKGSADTQTTWSNPSVRPHTQLHSNARQPSKGIDDAQSTGVGPCVPSNSAVADQEETGRGVNTLTTWSSNPDISTNVIDAQPHLGLYQQNIAHYPVSYVTYPVGFVYPYIALPQGVNAVSSQDSEVKDEPEKTEQSEVKLVKPCEQSVIKHTQQEHDSSTRTPSKNTGTVQWVIPQVQAGNVVQQGQFIDLASSLRYWQHLLLYRNQCQAAAAQALAGNLQCTSNTSAVTSSPTGLPQNTAPYSKGKEIEKLLGKESKDINNNLTVGCETSDGNEGNQSQAGFKSQSSLSSFEVKQSPDQRLAKSQSISPVFGSKVNPKPRRASVIHVVEPTENKVALGTCRNTPGSSNQHIWGHSTILSEKPERSEDWLGISKNYSSSTVTSCSEDTSSQAPATKELFNPMFHVQKPPPRFGEPCGSLREVERGSAPELSFVHENSIAYMNVRSHSEYGSKDIKKSASRSEDGVRPAKRRKSKKSL